MKILIAGANGYLGSRLTTLLATNNVNVVALVRNKERLYIPEKLKTHVTVIEQDLLKPQNFTKLPPDITHCYYLVETSCSAKIIITTEVQAISNLLEQFNTSSLKPKIIYVSPLIKGENLPPYLKAKQDVVTAIQQSGLNYTIIQSHPIFSEGSRLFSFQNTILQTRFFPICEAIKTKIQSLYVVDVLYYLAKIIALPQMQNTMLEIGSETTFSLQDMLLFSAREKKITPKFFKFPRPINFLSHYFLSLSTDLTFDQLQALLLSIEYSKPADLTTMKEQIPHECLSYQDSYKKSLSEDKKEIFASYKETFSSSNLSPQILEIQNLNENTYETSTDYHVYKGPLSLLWSNLGSCGGSRGWLYADPWLKSRGFLDKCLLGPGFQRGRSKKTTLRVGDTLDCYRVISINEEKKSLILLNEMKLPGTLWVEWKINQENEDDTYTLNATVRFKPNGLQSTLYWHLTKHLHRHFFNKMAQEIVTHSAVYFNARQLF